MKDPNLWVFAEILTLVSRPACFCSLLHGISIQKCVLPRNGRNIEINIMQIELISEFMEIKRQKCIYSNISLVVIIALTEVFDRTVPAKTIFLFLKIFTSKQLVCRFSSYSFRGNYSFLDLEIQSSQYIRPKVTVHTCVETIQGWKLYEEIH